MPEQIINLNLGWNLVSFYISVDLPQLTNQNDILQIKDLANAYISTQPVFLNTLNALEPENGYWIKCSGNLTISLTGQIITSVYYNITTGWNLISYPNSVVMPLNTFLNYSVLGDILQLKNLADAYISTQPVFLNTLNALDPGSAYWLKSDGGEDFSITFASGGPVSPEYFSHLNDISMVTIKPALSHTITVSTLTGDVSAGYDYLGMFIKSTDESTQTLRAVGKVGVHNTAYYIHTMVVNRMWDEGEPTWVDASFSNVSYYHITDLCDNWLDSSGIKLDLTSQFNNNLGNLSDNDWWDISMDISMSGQSTCSRIL